MDAMTALASHASGSRAIVGAMSATAFVGSEDKGPVDSPVRVRGIAEFKREFGALALGTR